MIFGPQRPMTLSEAQALDRRMADTRQLLYGGSMPSNVGEGLQRLGTGIGYAIQQQRLRSQFPNGVPGTNVQSQPPIKRFAEFVSGNQMPWQFPQAPGGSSAAQGTSFPKPGGLFGLALTMPKRGGGLW